MLKERKKKAASYWMRNDATACVLYAARLAGDLRDKSFTNPDVQHVVEHYQAARIRIAVEAFAYPGALDAFPPSILKALRDAKLITDNKEGADV